MSSSFERIRTLVAQLETLSEEERARRLDALGDDDLAREVRSLLQHAEGASIPTVPSFEEVAGARQANEVGDPETIGNYRIVRKLGAGGMGTVYEAQQDVPNRRVALKCIRADLVSSEVVRRFLKETEILGLLQHQGIAQIYDAGLSDQGHGPEPYIAMELVEGQTLLDFTRDKRLSTRARLELFVKICDAVQHAHQKGVIHRDLKPENIVVKEVSSTTKRGVTGLTGQPVVLDFGIARITDADLARATQQTEVGALIGTLPYMSPEQMSGETTDLDTRSDIYALGVILFELLAERLPIDVGGASVLEAVVRVQRDEPTRLGAVDRAFRGDLETIAARALEKEPQHRYASASELGGDVSRHLASEPILARRQTSLYQLSKFVRRNKGLAVGLAGMFVALAVGFVVSTSLFFTARDAKQVAEEATGEAEATNKALSTTLVERNELFKEERRQRKLAEDNEGRARRAEAVAREESERATREAQRAEDKNADLELVSEFQSKQLSGIDVPRMAIGLRESMIQAAPEAERQALAVRLKDVNFTNVALATLKENLFDRSLEAIDVQFEGQPLIQASLLESMATTLRIIGFFEMAVAPQARSLSARRELLGDTHTSTLESLVNSSELLMQRGELSAAEAYAREAVAGIRLHADRDDSQLLLACNALGWVLVRRGAAEEAATHFRESIERNRDRPEPSDLELYHGLSGLSVALKLMGQLERAETVCREANEVFKGRTIRGYLSSGLGSLGTLGGILQDQKRFEEAEVVYRELLPQIHSLYGDDHLNTLTAESNFGNLLQEQGKLEEAEPFVRAAVENYKRLLGATHPTTLIASYNLGTLVQDLGDVSAAEELIAEAWSRLRVALDPSHPAIRDVGLRYERLLRARLSVERAASQQPRLSEALVALGVLLTERGSFAQAEPVLTEVAGWALDADSERSNEIVEKLVAMYEAWHAIAPSAGYDALAESGLGRYVERDALLCTNRAGCSGRSA